MRPQEQGGGGEGSVGAGAQEEARQSGVADEHSWEHYEARGEPKETFVASSRPASETGRRPMQREAEEKKEGKRTLQLIAYRGDSPPSRPLSIGGGGEEWRRSSRGASWVFRSITALLWGPREDTR